MSDVAVANTDLLSCAQRANVEHDLVVRAGSQMIDHAIAAGEALNEARTQCVKGEWMDWLAVAALGVSHPDARNAMFGAHKNMTLRGAR